MMGVLEGNLQLLCIRRRGWVEWEGAHRAKACVCDGCCHTEADRLARCEGGDLPGLNGHV